MELQKRIIKLVEDSIIDTSKNNLFFDFALVKVQDASILKQLTAQNFIGYRHTLDSSGIIHSLKHANITMSDILLIPYIINSYDVMGVGIKEGTIVYKKQIVNEYFYVEEIRKGRKKLAIKTLYKRKRR